jgi:pro-apoptotic serine protease NMA111
MRVLSWCVVWWVAVVGLGWPVLAVGAPGSLAATAPEPAALGGAPSREAWSGDDLLAAPLGSGGTRWQKVLDDVVQAVVSIRVTAVRDFDTEDASVSQGTGFVVDAERGLILTNRHMVHAGPVVAEAVFLDEEEVELAPVYRDPIHDFGIFQFDPAAVKQMQVVALPLVPEAARVGTEIRVVGNDAGEKISILDGTLARLDRNAPFYGGDEYNDFNTFYIQAASNTSGGSSGSPVVDILGRVVALNAGGATQAASSFYLPLHRVVRALAQIREGSPVARGTLQTEFVHTPFDELGRLGLDPETAELARKTIISRQTGESLVPTGLGMLVVEQVLPEGPAADALRPGDVLVRLNGELCTDFVTLEAVLDDAVGQTVTLSIQRGGDPLELVLEVGDLHAITPDEFLEVGRGVFHTLSYTQAHNHHLPVRGVYLAVSGYIWSTADVPHGSVFSHIDGVEVPDLDTLQRELEQKADGQRIRIRFWLVGDPDRSYETVAVMDRDWYPMRRCQRDDETGLWPCSESSPPPPLQPPAPAGFLPVKGEDRVSNKVARSLVMVDFDIPYPTAGVKDLNYVGVGTVIDAQRGLVLVDRDTVPVALGDMTLTFAGTVRVPGQLVYLHPTHNIAVIRYDPSLVGSLPVEAVTFDTSPLEEKDRVWQIGLDGEQDLVTVKTRVDRIEPLQLGQASTPRFRDTNVAGVWLEEAVDSYGGVVVDRRGHVRALWASFLDQASGERGFYGLPLAYMMPVLSPLLRGDDPHYRTLGIELRPLTLAAARDRGLSDRRVRELLSHDPEARQILEIQQVNGMSPAKGLVRDTDLLIAVNGRPVTQPREVEAVQQRESMTFTVLRDTEEIVLEVPTFEVDGRGVDRIVSWAGLVLHEPHLDVAAQQGIDAAGVYIAWLWFGSPAQRYGIRPTRRIVRVNDVPTPDLSAFLAAVAMQRDRQPVRLALEKLDGTEMVATLKLDLQYWPTEEIALVDGVWVRRTGAEVAAAVDAMAGPDGVRGERE